MRMQLSAKIKSLDFIISITRNTLKEEMEVLLSSYIHGYHVYKDILDSYHWRGAYLWGCVPLCDNTIAVGTPSQESVICFHFMVEQQYVSSYRTRRHEKLTTRNIK